MAVHIVLEGHETFVPMPQTDFAADDLADSVANQTLVAIEKTVAWLGALREQIIAMTSPPLTHREEEGEA